MTEEEHITLSCQAIAIAEKACERAEYDGYTHRHLVSALAAVHLAELYREHRRDGRDDGGE